ncbi:2-dehydro-3-deoxy-6-phosphogalactonate aldolase [Telmatospirillum sp. J64-1]|uniref:2-dehydro-3-deoxy-6-phosphogalactonate aldolase n=1 Tax=Telmatospirillum sp. J64-1 TaxID=2502183 RepID=UPI00115EE9B0|nr:2-dehydro-3-deoxy-6-phosphogalactonate aldolase [Telmatospirillum sp. J64-1]
MSFHSYFSDCPLVAILRGVAPEQAVEVGQSIARTGIRILEVPLNSPDPFVSIARMADALGETCLVGAGTVTSVAAVDEVARAGGRLIVCPHTDVAVIRRAKELDMACLPGIATPSEAFAALGAGADGLKLFPAEAMPPAVLRAMRTVLPTGTLLLPVGGITPESMAAYKAAGAAGFGIGSALYSPKLTVEEIAARAADFVAAWRKLEA